MNDLTLRVSLPIRSYLKKYIAKTKDVDPFKIEYKRCPYSAIIIEPMLKEEKFINIKELEKSSIEKARFNDELVCVWDSVLLKEKKFWFSHDALVLIDFRLKELFDASMISFIEMVRSKHVTIEDAILHFCNHYDIEEEDLALETAQKMYYRARYPKPLPNKEISNDFIVLKLFD